MVVTSSVVQHVVMDMLHLNVNMLSRNINGGATESDSCDLYVHVCFLSEILFLVSVPNCVAADADD